MAKYIVQHRRGTVEQWMDNDTIIPRAGEIVIEIDEINSLHKLKIGDGIHTYADLKYLMAGDEIVTQVLTQALPRVVTVTLDVDNWKQIECETDPNLGYYGQTITLDNITPQSRLDLQPNADMLAEFKQLDLVFVTENKTENNESTITVYSVGDMPLKTYTMQATIIETDIKINDDKVVGIPVGTPTTKADWSQTDDTKADYIKNKPHINKGEASESLVHGHTLTNWNIYGDDNTGVNGKVVEYIDQNKGNENKLPVQIQIIKEEDGEVRKVVAGAFGEKSVSFGTKSQALGNKSFAEGSKTIAFGNNTHAEGNGTFAVGQHSHAEGNGTTTIGNASHAEGCNTAAEGDSSHAEGHETFAEGDRSHAEGYITHAIGDNSHSEGFGTIAEHDDSHVEGLYTITGGGAQHVQGKWNEVMGGDYAHVVGNGSDDYHRSNAHTLDWEGNAWFAGNVTVGTDNKKLITEVEVDIKLASLVDSAPETLNTLNELATALGEDPNFATTISTELGKKIDKTTFDEEINKINASIGETNLNFTNGEGSNSIVQGVTTSNWNPDNSEPNQTIVEYVTNENVNENGLKIQVDDSGNIIAGAFGSGSAAFGTKSQALGGKSFAEGSKTVAFANNAHAEGNSTFAVAQNTHAEGYKTTAKGFNSHAEGRETLAIGDNSHTEGESTEAFGKSSHSEGTNTKSIGDYSHAEGYGTEARTIVSHAEGDYTIASGEISHAEGYNSQAEGRVSHAEGYNTQTIGEASHSEGRETKATGDSSHAEGYNSESIGDYSHAEGRDTKASGPNSHAEGNTTVAYGNQSHAEGMGTYAYHSQHAQGRYNVVDTESQYAHIVGNGESDIARSNAHTLDWNGNAWFSGNITIGANKDKLLTETEVNNKIDALINGAPGTLDTLNEIATALGNDPSFATTIINMLSEKVNSSELSKVATSGNYNDLDNVPVKNFTGSVSSLDDMLEGGYFYSDFNQPYNGGTYVFTMADEEFNEEAMIKDRIYTQVIIDKDGIKKRRKINSDDPNKSHDWKYVPLHDDTVTKADLDAAIGDALEGSY